MSCPILFAYSLNGKGGGTPLKNQEIHQSSQLHWIHLDAEHDGTEEWLEKEMVDLDPLILKALLADETRPRMIQLNEGVLLVLRGVNLNENSAPEDMVSVRLWVEKDRIISTRRRKLKAVVDIEEKIKKGLGPKTAGDFICMLSSRLFERMEPVLSELDESTDVVEETLIEKTDFDLRESIVDIRKKAILFRRYMAPQRDAIGQLCLVDLKWIKEAHKRSLQESFNHVTRYVEDLDAIRERSQIIKDELANLMADKLNKNMYILSIIAAIFLPLGFLTGLLGVNIDGIPGTENPNAFLIFSMLLGIIFLIQLILFKWFKWL